MSLTRKESMQVLSESRSKNIKHQRDPPSLSEWLHQLFTAALMLAAAAAFVTALTLCAVSSPSLAQRHCRYLNMEPAVSQVSANDPIKMGQGFFGLF